MKAEQHPTMEVLEDCNTPITGKHLRGAVGKI
jgi:hypothetical protein